MFVLMKVNSLLLAKISILHADFFCVCAGVCVCVCVCLPYRITVGENYRREVHRQISIQTNVVFGSN